ncbi:MAG: hypothetical protein R3B45_09255 [Bdellovibrionota bacterium]
MINHNLNHILRILGFTLSLALTTHACSSSQQDDESLEQDGQEQEEGEESYQEAGNQSENYGDDEENEEVAGNYGEGNYNYNDNTASEGNTAVEANPSTEGGDYGNTGNLYNNNLQQADASGQYNYGTDTAATNVPTNTAATNVPTNTAVPANTSGAIVPQGDGSRVVRYITANNTPVHSQPDASSSQVASMMQGDAIMVTLKVGEGVIADGHMFKQAVYRNNLFLVLIIQTVGDKV